MKRATAAIVLCSALMTACAPTNHVVVLRELRAQLADEVHSCVPLGWVPVPVGHWFYPGYTAQYQDERSWLAPMWLGSIRRTDLRNPQARTSAAILADLSRQGLVRRSAAPHGWHYRMTTAAMQYFYARDAFHDNPDGFPYLCYSTMVPDRVVRTDEIRTQGKQRIFHAVFSWHPSAPAPWADKFLRAHSVILAPSSSTAIATMSEDAGKWYVTALQQPDDVALPRVASTTVWR